MERATPGYVLPARGFGGRASRGESVGGTITSIRAGGAERLRENLMHWNLP